MSPPLLRSAALAAALLGASPVLAARPLPPSGTSTPGTPASNAPTAHAPASPASAPEGSASNAPAANAPVANAPAANAPAANAPAASAPAAHAPAANAPAANAPATNAPAANAPAAEAPASAEAKPEVRPSVPPEAPRCARGAANELLEQGRHAQRQKGPGGGADRALALYSAALKKDPSCTSALWEMGWSYLAKGDYDGAVAAWDRLRKLSPGYPELDVQYPAVLARREAVAALRQLPDPGQIPPPESTPAEGPTLTIRAVGDVNMGMAWPPDHAALPPNDALDLFAQVKPLLQDADVTFGNLETVLADSGDSSKCGKKSNRCYAFRVPTSFAKALKDAGFDVMSIANNHAGDFGPEGRIATIGALDAVGIKHSGPIGDVASFEAKGRKIALVAFSFGADMYRLQEIETGRRLVAFLGQSHDLVFVSFHGGAEGKGAEHVPLGTEMFLGEDRGDERAFAHAMVDAGADLLIGHGPHLLRAMEVYKGRLIAYSLGNFSSWEVFGLYPPNNLTGILEVKLAPNGVALSAQVMPVIIEKPGRPVPDPEARALPILRSLSQEDFGSPLLDAEGRWSRAEAASEKAP